MDRLLNSASWGRKPGNDNDSQREPRRKQVESLFMELPQLRAIPNDESRFQLPLQLSSNSDPANSPSTTHTSRISSLPVLGSTHSSGSSSATASSNAMLTIFLPASFPEEEPKITIQPTVRHLWVDGSVTPCAVTGHERLVPGGWSTHANLGRIVKEIAVSIQRTGVLVAGDHNEAYSSNTGTTGLGNNGSSGGKAGYDEYSHKPPPPIPNRSKSQGPFINNHSTSPYSNMNGSHGAAGSASLSSSSSHFVGANTIMASEVQIIMDLTAEQIEEYLESPIAFDHFFDHLKVVVDSRTHKREWWDGNENVSRRNLQLEAEMAELQKSTKEDHQVAMQLQKSLEEKLQEQQDSLWRFKPDTLQSKLRSAAAESEELSESVAQSFLEGKLDQDSFIRQYRDLRKVYHLREMKNERIGPILRNNNSNNNNSSTADRMGSIHSKTGAGTGLGPVTGAGSGVGSGSGMIGAGSSGSGGSGKGSGNGSSSSGVGGTSGSGAGSSDPWVML
ncbi:hypothetical protein BGZ98_007460 [Dissophora globulifera]|nr:hypothetical protein BGZ98_007460 [Dissophora globulifera]